MCLQTKLAAKVLNFSFLFFLDAEVDNIESGMLCGVFKPLCGIHV